MATAMKQCPRCAEMVLAEARACRFCGYDPETIASATAEANTRQILWALAAGLAVFLVGLPVLFLAIGVW